MQDEEIDKIIKEAADRHHPPYDDQAWGKMEQLLDKHLPQQKDRRKYILFLLLFLLLDAAIFLAIVKPWKSDNATIAENSSQKTVVTDSKTAPTIPTGNNPSGDQSGNVSVDSEKANTPNTPDNTAGQSDKIILPDYITAEISKPDLPVNATGIKNKRSAAPRVQPGSVPNSLSQNKNTTTSLTTKPGYRKPVNQKGKMVAKISQPDMGTSVDEPVIMTDQPVKEVKVEEPVTTPVTNNELTGLTATPQQDKENESVSKPVADTTTTAVTASVDRVKKDLTPTPEKKKEKQHNKFADNFAITLSAGPELSYVSMNDPGKTTLLYGAGVGYTFAKHFTVRSGFYASKKLYSATPEQYSSTNPPNPNLKSIEADCKVYEIPLSLSYNFGQRKNHNWFAGAGLSSYLMKTETYIYKYKTAGGQAYDYKHSISNENKHFFSVLSLSAGYQYHFSKRVSVMAEPFVKLPLNGVGLGKINLSSAGLMLTLNVKPFARKN